MSRKSNQAQVVNHALNPQLNGEAILHNLAQATAACDMAYNALATAVEYRTKFKVKLPATVEKEMESAIAAAAIQFVHASIALSDLKALHLMYQDQIGASNGE